MNGSRQPAFVMVAAMLLVASCRPIDAATLVVSDSPRLPSPGFTDAVMQQFAADNNLFALELYRRVSSADGNLVFSPYSLTSALAMTFAGARNKTESQMVAAMHYGLPQEQLHQAFNQLEQMLTTSGELAAEAGQPLTLKTANSIWAEADLPILDAYLDVMAANYGTGVRLTDFAGDVEQSRREINSWVSQQTEKRINDLIPEGSLETSTRMVLVNAIYFNADWLDPFDAADTRAAPFRRLDGTSTEVSMMHGHPSGASFVGGDGFQAVRLPYAGDTTAMTILVPDDGSFLAFESGISAEQLTEITRAMAPASIQLALPKFSFSSSFDAGDQLSSLGMPDAFDPDRADSSGITGSPDLYIDKVFHQAFVAVDEKGTEAAAATSVIMGPTSAMLPDLTLIVDRPFLFVMSDLRTGQILFLGRVVDPTL